MPNATVSQEVVRKQLHSLEGAWIEVKQLPFGKMLERRDKASRFMQELDPRARNANMKVQIDIMNEWSRRFDFKECIVDHNLEDANGGKLDFGNPMTFDILDPKVGSEIERIIDELNQEDEQDLEDFPKSLTSSSVDNGKKLSDISQDS
jgi:hypothetical protein